MWTLVADRTLVATITDAGGTGAVIGAGAHPGAVLSSDDGKYDEEDVGG